LLSDAEATRVSGVREQELKAVRVIDDGPVRTIVEALFGYGDSFLIVHYKLPKTGTELEVELRVHWNEKDRLLKLAVPTPFQGGAYHGQVAYGRDVLAAHDKEVVAQKWVALESRKQDLALTCINNGTYGSDCVDGEMRLTLLRSPAYCGHPIAERAIVQQDRYTPRIDQGERLYRFWFNGGPAPERLTAIDREALAKNEAPMVLSFFPSGAGETPPNAAELSDDALQITAFKQSEDGEDYILRLFEPTGQDRTAQLSIPVLNTQEEVRLQAFEIKSYRINAKNGNMQECDLLERPI
jgi:alpha-mannosidase